MSGLLPGFSAPVEQAQTSFKALLMANSYPGRIGMIDLGIKSPGDMAPALYALALSLFDTDTSLWIEPNWEAANEGALSKPIKFHCNCPLVTETLAADMAVAKSDDLPDLARAFNLGTDEYPDRSATLFIQVPALEGGLKTRWTGPGIKDQIFATIAGLDADFWDQRNLACSAFPLGLDIVFCCGDHILALPRSTKVEVM